MSTSLIEGKKYTIRETAKISGLPESTLRYYESIGLVKPIKRDDSSKYRVYGEDDINAVIGLACLNAIGFSIDDMRQYLSNRDDVENGATSQIELLTNHANHIRNELHFMQLRLEYVESKAAFWRAVRSGNKKHIKATSDLVYTLADKMKLPKPLSVKSRPSKQNLT